jgi:hypothetical protein
MPYEGPGRRHDAVATKDCVHGQIVVENNVVGTAFKNEQLSRWVNPADVDTNGRLLTQLIDASANEDFTIMVGGIHEAPRTGTLNAVDVGGKVWIDPADNSLEVAVAAGRLPVGVVTEVDTARDVVLINSNAWQAFLPGA